MEHQPPRYNGQRFVKGYFALLILLTWRSMAQAHDVSKCFVRSTLPETNIAPENRPSQKEISISTIHFQVLC